MDGPAFKKDWVLTQDAFDGLLSRLDPDRERAAQHYEQIRRALITFFECRGSATAEDHADTTINRAARRLIEGQDIHAGNPASYFYGVARNVLKESWEAAARQPAAIEAVRSHATAIDPERQRQQDLDRRQHERRLECLERCLQDLSAEHRELIAAYYQGETSVKISNRKQLAVRLGIPMNALRIRALRIRERLEACVKRLVNSAIPIEEMGERP